MKKLIAGFALGAVLFSAWFVSAQDRREWLGHMYMRQWNPSIYFDGTLAFKRKSDSTTLFQVNSSGALFGTNNSVAISRMVLYRANLTPVTFPGALQGSAPLWYFSTNTSQSFTVTGLAVTDTVFVNGPAHVQACAPVHWRISAADTLVGVFNHSTQGPCTPTAGIYQVFAIRT